MRRADVTTTSAKVTRGSLGEQNVPVYVVGGEVALSQNRVSSLFSRLRAVLPDGEADYIRISMPETKAVAFADYATDTFVLVDPESEVITDLDRPGPTFFEWEAGIDRLEDLAR